MALPGVCGSLRRIKARLHVEVTNLNDAGAGSLRDAIAQANAAPDLAAVITFQSGLTGTIALATQLNITESVNLVGPGSDVITLEGNVLGTRCLYFGNFPDQRKIDVNVSGLTCLHGGGQGGGNIISWGVDLKLRDVKMLDGDAFDAINGNGGGGIYLYGGPHGSRVLIEDCVISGNHSTRAGGGMAVGGSNPVDVTLRRSDVSDNDATGGGGGVSMLYDGVMTIEDSTISGNTALGGGGVYGGVGATDRVMTVRRCTIEDNAGNMVGGGGGGVSVNAGAFTIEDSTVSGNQAAVGGGLQLYRASVEVTNTTVSGNSALYAGGIEIDSAPSASLKLTTISGNDASGAGGGMRLYNGTTEMDNSIVGGNTAAAQPDVHTITGGVLDAHYVLIQDPGTANITGANNITGQDPQLGALADNGGPTETMLPAPSSPAVNAGDPAFTPPPATDQRGLPRVVGGRLDMGSVELQ